MDIREMEISVPWGHISLKLWGNETDPAILVVHGIMDNAGSFDAIIPLLPQNYFYICVDLPGHGRSSHFPPHLPIHTINFLIVFTLVIEYFKRERFIIMGHSFGGQLGFLYAQLYPEKVEKLVMFDTVHTFPVSANYFAQFLVERFNSHLGFEEKKQKRAAPQYTFEEAFDKLMMVRPTPLTEKAAKSLLNRMLVPKENGKYEMSLDQRLKFCINPLHDTRYILDTIKEDPIKCPILIIFGKENGVQRKILRPILNAYKKQRNVTVKYVSGHHDVHSTDPERVAPLVEQFLNLQKSKL